MAFLFFRLVTPVLSLAISAFYTFVVAHFEFAVTIKLGIIVLATYIGLKMPELYLKNTISKRQHSMGRAFPDAMDLLLICVESGMSIEHAFRKVAGEIGVQSIPLAEELTLVTAELSYLPDRRSAYSNLGVRTGLRLGEADHDRSHTGRTLRHPSWHRLAGRCPGKPRQSYDARRKKGCRIAAQIDGTDDIVFSPRAFRGYLDAGNHSDQPHGTLKNANLPGSVRTFMVSSLSGRIFELRLMSELRKRGLKAADIVMRLSAERRGSRPMAGVHRCGCWALRRSSA